MAKVTNEVRLERLQHLKTIIKKTKPSEFDWGNWGQKKVKLPVTGGRPTPCGTVGCILGNAAFDPKFNKQGLQAKVSGDPDCETSRGQIELHFNIDIIYGRKSYIDAGAAFFGLNTDEATFLFMPKGRSGKLEALRAINVLIHRFQNDWQNARQHDGDLCAQFGLFS